MKRLLTLATAVLAFAPALAGGARPHGSYEGRAALELDRATVRLELAAERLERSVRRALHPRARYRHQDTLYALRTLEQDARDLRRLVQRRRVGAYALADRFAALEFRFEDARYRLRHLPRAGWFRPERKELRRAMRDLEEIVEIRVARAQAARYARSVPQHHPRYRRYAYARPVDRD